MAAPSESVRIIAPNEGAWLTPGESASARLAPNERVSSVTIGFEEPLEAGTSIIVKGPRPRHHFLRTAADIYKNAVDTDGPQKLFTLAKNIFEVVAVFRPNLPLDFSRVTGSAVQCLDILDLYNRGHWLACEERKSWQDNAAQVCLTSQHILATMQFCQDVNLLDLGRLNATIGCVPVLGAVATTLNLGYRIFSLLDNIRECPEIEDDHLCQLKMRASIIDNIAQIIFSCVTLATMCGVMALSSLSMAVLAVTVAAIGVSKYFIHKFHEEVYVSAA